MHLKSRLLATVAGLAFIATPALAADLGGDYAPPAGDPIYSPTSMVAGDLQLSLGYIDFDGDSAGLFNGQGRANVNFGGWNVLLELDGQSIFEDGKSYSGVSVLGHVWAGQAVRYGAFGGVMFPTGPNIAAFGLEAEADIGSNVVLGGQGFYFTDIADGFDFDGFGLRGWADVYFNPNTKLTGELAWLDSDFGDAWGATARVTHRVAGTPFNVFAEADYVDVDNLGDSWSALGGFSILFDGGAATQREFDRAVPFEFSMPGGFLY